jgi:D-glycero-D-manno-heptose 1,7-bisphosphate phosphatase
MLRALVFDRDGTLNVPGPGGYVLTPDQMTLLPGAAEALALVRQRGLKTFVFTQQSCIGKGLVSRAGVDAIHDRMQTLLGPQARVDGFYLCPHVEADQCGCRKPKPGLLTALLADHGFVPGEILVIGDSARDEAAARAAGAAYVHVGPKEVGQLPPGTATYPDVLAAVKAVAGVYFLIELPAGCG